MVIFYKHLMEWYVHYVLLLDRKIILIKLYYISETIITFLNTTNMFIHSDCNILKVMSSLLKIMLEDKNSFKVTMMIQDFKGLDKNYWHYYKNSMLEMFLLF
jgi:hypothetical protein